nr:MAG TPA: hypothetical protein [Bacteriophage sp.]
MKCWVKPTFKHLIKVLTYRHIIHLYTQKR